MLLHLSVLSTGGSGGVYPSMQWDKEGVVCIPACNGEAGGLMCIPACNWAGTEWVVHNLLECILNKYNFPT